MLLIFLFLLDLTNGGSKCHCYPCACQQIQRYVWVDCSYRGLNKVPANLPRNTTHLDLSNNNIGFSAPMGGGGLGELRNFTMLEELRLNNNHLIFLGMELAHMTSLKKLVLDMNGIFHVNTAAFRGLHKLKDLSLKHNSIRHFDPRLLSDLTSLETLDVGDNKLEVMTNEMFLSQRQLKKLNLKKNNIEQLYEGTLTNCPRLVTLNLEDNILSTLPQGLFSNSVKLKEIYLARNKLMFVLSWTFRYLYNLEVLDLSNNSIIMIEPLPSPWNLRVFDLSGNMLRSLPMETLYEMRNANSTVLGLYGNRLDCVPSFLNRFLSYMQTTNVTLTMRSDIKCASPQSLEGQVIGRFQCPVIGATLEVCAGTSDLTCNETENRNEVGSAQCTARCACPQERPLVVNGSCQTGAACSLSVKGVCAQHRMSSLYPKTSSYVPSCDEEGLYRALQCNDNKCWCVTKQGLRFRSTFDYSPTLTDQVCTEHQIAMSRTCAVWGNGRVLQFDGTAMQVKTDCYYALANDISRDSRFNIYTRLAQCANNTTCVASVLLFVKRIYPILVNDDLTIYCNGSLYSLQEGENLSLIQGQISISRNFNMLRLEYIEDGVTVVFGGRHYLTVNIGQSNSFEKPEHKITGACGTLSTLTNDETPLYGLDMMTRWKLIRTCSDPTLVTLSSTTDFSCAHLSSPPFNTCTIANIDWVKICSEDSDGSPAMFCLAARLYSQLCADQGVRVVLRDSGYYAENC